MKSVGTRIRPFPIIFDSRRLVTQVVAAHVRRDDVIMPSQHRQLMPPRIPKLGKAVKQDDKLFVAGSTFRIMQTNVVDVCKAVTNRHLALWLHDLWSTQQTPDPRSHTK